MNKEELAEKLNQWFWIDRISLDEIADKILSEFKYEKNKYRKSIADLEELKDQEIELLKNNKCTCYICKFSRAFSKALKKIKDEKVREEVKNIVEEYFIATEEIIIDLELKIYNLRRDNGNKKNST